jgi:deoxycytidine triphosphate deaminase/intein/homing endonuclease
MVLSDRSIREAIANGRIIIDPLGDDCIQPSSVDLHLDNLFRVFLNHTMDVIDVKADQEDLTELVKVPEDQYFVLHPGEFVLGSTSERVKLPDDLVARIEGKSSLGRLGLLIHSSLPAGERILVRLEGSELCLLPIDEVVTKQIPADVVAFDPETFEVAYHPITGWYEGPADKIYEVVLESGRRVRVTAGHNLFTLDRMGGLKKIRTGELRPGVMVAIPKSIPDPVEARSPGGTRGPVEIRVVDLIPEVAYSHLMVAGPSVAKAFASQRDAVVDALRANGQKHVRFYETKARLPFNAAAVVPGLLNNLTADDRLSVFQGRSTMPAVIAVTPELSWTLGMYVAEGYHRKNQVTISNTVQARLDRVADTCRALGASIYRVPGAITASSGILSMLIDWIGANGYASEKRVPFVVYSWPKELIEHFLRGYIDGDGSDGATRNSLWTSSPGLVDDMLYLLTRLGRRASASFRARPDTQGLFQVSVPYREHKLLTAVPLPDELLIELRHAAGMSQTAASAALGFTNNTDLCNIERRYKRDAVRLETLRKFQRTYPSDNRLDRLVDGGILWDRVAEIREVGWETIYDIEVRPRGRKIENFVAGYGGAFVSNTAGFVDAGWDGHLTLELANVANLPIRLYPGMKIGQVSFFEMTTPAENPYGKKSIGSKYQGQRGPTPSRYFENFKKK